MYASLVVVQLLIKLIYDAHIYQAVHFKAVNDETLYEVEIISVSHNRMEMLLPEGQGEIELFLDVGGQPTATLDFSYDPPSITSITPLNGNTDGGYEMVIYGESFGTGDEFRGSLVASASVTIGLNECEVTHQSHTELRCLVPGGVGANHTVVVNVEELTSSETLSFSYDLPEIRCEACGFTQNPVDSSGTSLTICGENFGPYFTDDISVNVLETECQNAQWKKDTFICGSKPHIRCDLPSTYVGMKNVTITVGGQTNFFESATNPVLKTMVRKAIWKLRIVESL